MDPFCGASYLNLIIDVHSFFITHKTKFWSQLSFPHMFKQHASPIRWFSTVASGTCFYSLPCVYSLNLIQSYCFSLKTNISNAKLHQVLKTSFRLFRQTALNYLNIYTWYSSVFCQQFELLPLTVSGNATKSFLSEGNWIL